MPVYEYACTACDHEFEREQRISDSPLRKCPACGAMKARRLISRTSFVLKGGGWYNDLYASPSDGKKSDASGGDSPAESKPESKPGSKSTPDGGTKKSAKGAKAAA